MFSGGFVSHYSMTCWQRPFSRALVGEQEAKKWTRGFSQTCHRKSRALLLYFHKLQLLAVVQKHLVMSCGPVDFHGWEGGKTMLVTTGWRNGQWAAVTEMQGSCLQSKALTAGVFSAVEVWLPWQPVFSWIFALVESPSVPATLFWNVCFAEK